MAYGNWGAFVYRNGERMTTHEDQTPYRESELQAGYGQAFVRRENINPHHAVLGSGRVRMCGYKDWPVLFLDGNRVAIEQYRRDKSIDTDKWSFSESDGIEGELDGCRFSAVHTDDPGGVELSLIEPDGAVWNSHCGYCIGAGHQD